MDGIPFEARQPGSAYRLAHQPDDERICVLSAFREYFNLCSEEKWLYEHRKVDRATWNIWVSIMQIVAQFPCFSGAWEALGLEYDCYEEFQNLVTYTLLPHAVASRQGDRADGVVAETTMTNSGPSADSLAKPPRRQAIHQGRTDARDAHAHARRSAAELKTEIG